MLSPLLRYLLTQGRQEDAEQLVQRSARHPHFSHSLEWLVFTVLEKEYSVLMLSMPPPSQEGCTT